jgi:hypothetical protein
MIARLIQRRLLAALSSAVAEVPAVALLGPRQVGKTTLAHESLMASAPSGTDAYFFRT